MWIESIIYGLGGVSLLVAVVYFCTKKAVDIAISAKLEEYKKTLEFDAIVKAKASLVAELLSEWIKNPMDASKVNKLLWEATMWLPENEAIAINELLCHKSGTTKEMIVKVRNIIQSKESKISAEQIVHFKNDA